MAVDFRKYVVYVLITVNLSPLGAWSWNILVIVDNELIPHTNLLCEWQQVITSIVPGITGHWLCPC